MIKKISKVHKIGKFANFKQEQDFKYEKGQNCNIIFGFNASGKTTLSNLFSFFANSSFINEDRKKNIYNDIKNETNSLVEITLQDNNKIKYPSSKIHSKSIYIFNSNFITSHVFNGTKANLKKISNISGEIKNIAIKNINERIDRLNKEKMNAEQEIEQSDRKYDIISKSKSKEFEKNLTDKNKRLTPPDVQSAILSKKNIEELTDELDRLYSDYELSKRQNDLNVDLTIIKQLKFNLIDLDCSKVDNLLLKDIQQLSKEVLEKKIREIQNLFSDDQYKQSVEGWFKFGKVILENINRTDKNYCPICDTDISKKITLLLKDYQGYFDKSYEGFMEELKKATEDISLGISIIDQCEQGIKELENMKIKYQKPLKGLISTNYDFKHIKQELQELRKYVILKTENIQKKNSKPPNIEENIGITNSIINDFKTLKSSILQRLESKKLNTHQIEGKIRETYKEIIISEFNSIDQQGALNKYKKNKERIKVIMESTNTEEGLPFWKGKLREELKKIKVESKSISKYLKEMGIDHFDIDINEKIQDENIIIKYKEILNERNKLENCLSESEKTALAFSYFLSKFEHEVNIESKIKDSVVIIDDPISSLDDNRLYSTANLIWRNFTEIKQLIVLSHNFLFLKFFNSFYKKKKANCLFLDQDKICVLPGELQNFETPYFYMLRNIIDFIEPINGNITYDQAKKFLPNFIRRVLETFLSFKFSRIVSKRGEQRSPGLEDFDDHIDSTNIENSIKEELRKKIVKIKKISDAHSHGNAQHTQENFYISKTDLKICAESAIEVIKIMDNLHKTSLINK